MYCLSPPLDELPQGDWFCPDCIAAANDAEDIGFNSGKTFTIEQFKEECARFDAQFFGQDEPVSIPDIEEAFWKMVEEGATSIDGGDLPVNCSGGVLSSNPIGASGMIRFGEAALQVMGLAGDHQVDGAKTAVGHAYGGAAQYYAMWVVGADR